MKKTIWNSVANNIIVEAGRESTVIPMVYRDTRPTEPFGADAISVLPFTSVMLDKRAPGLFTSMISGPNAKLEWLAESMVRYGTVGDVAKRLMEHGIVAEVNDRLLKGSARFKQGTVLMSYPALLRTMFSVCGASSDRNDPKRVTARVLAEIFARIYSAFNVIMPSRPVYTQEVFEKPVAMTDDLITASYVATVTETLETLKLGTSLKEKEFSAQVVESLLGPMLLAAANRLLAAEKYNRWMRDAACITGMYLRNSSDPVLDALRDDGNLQILSANASFALDAMVLERFGRGVLSPVHEHREILQYAALRLRELRRFETVSMDKFANMYSFTQIKTAKGRVAGTFIMRNIEVTCNAKAIALHEDSEIFVPMNAYAIDPYVPMLNEFVNSAFAGQKTMAAVHAFAQHVVARATEREPDRLGGRIVAFDLTEDELRMLACAHAHEIIISSSMTRVGPGGAPVLFFGIRDGRVNYQANAFYNGTQVYTSDHGELLTLTGEDFSGNQRFITKPQTYAEDIFGGLLDSVNPLLYNSATRSVNVILPLPDGTDVDLGLSLYNLLTGQETRPDIASFIAVDMQMARVISCLMAFAVVAHEDLVSHDDTTDRMMAEQVATGLHHMLSEFIKPIGFTRFMRTLTVQLMASDNFGERDRRALLTNVVTQHSLAIRLAVAFLLRMGLIPYGLQDDIVEILTDSRAVERAATSEAFKAIFAIRA